MIYIKTIQKIFILIVFILLFVPLSQVMAQGPPPPPGGATGNDQAIGGGAPIGGGSLILIGLAMAYGGRKLFKLRTEEEE